MSIPIQEIPNPSDVLMDVVQGTGFDHPDLFDPLKRDIRFRVRNFPAAMTVREAAEELRTSEFFRKVHNPARRNVMAAFFDAYPASTTAGDVATAMECI